ncbi:hypothetical protein, variant 1 [Aphanomyces invadans]|uniref:Phospholipase A-2-activating protein n=1 Tax=Aphanomyces invadans TaxID=157072 RepID=A0A024UF31_9STRA|nr:hypothetical protein, variant 1 [Aphanomyces invadans]ETW04472.1 hypothetical protein, variant 1 [Aphanomyces invadans]|eukprot:XP_008867428.1 hypothetical protein, variant 1 [Aphanomyces invadans]
MATSSTSGTTYSIAHALTGHGGAVRAIADVHGTVVTGAMDATVLCWDVVSSAPKQSIYEHSHWVTAIVPLDAAHEAILLSEGFATGGMDTHVRIFTRSDGLYTCVAVLKGHSSGVISLSWLQNPTTPQLLSGSWDGTCRGWDIASQTCRFVLPDHENGVCVLGLPNGVIATGSTGKQQGNQVVDARIRMWHAVSPTEYALTRTLSDHQGPVRQLVQVDAIGFASCSNDGSIKLRAADDGAVLVTCQHPLNHEGKPGFVLGLAYLPQSQHLVSASEDSTARVWSLDGTCVQTIDHPSGLWCVSALANGDFATGAEDKSVRVFSYRTPRNDALETALATQVAEAHVQAARGPSAVEVESLPPYDMRASQVGKSDGMVQMFRRDNVAWACQWSAVSGTWLDIGQVTGTGSGGVVDGEAYDMVIPVEIETPSGVKKLEIGYNQGQNPFTVAQAFIDKHLLNPSYLKEIADYISDRSANYQPPILGDRSTSASGAPAVSPAPVASPYFPLRTYATFDSAKIAKLLATVEQFNTLHPVLEGTDLAQLGALITTLQQTSYYHSSTITKSQVATVWKLLDKWPPTHAFPALDLVRLMLVHPMGATHITDTTAVLRHAFARDAADATRFLAIRVLVNWAPHAPTKLVAQIDAVASGIHSSWPPTASWSKPLALSVATLWMNATLALSTGRDDEHSAAAKIVSTQLAELLGGNLDEEALGRVLVAIGSLAVAFPTSVATIPTSVLRGKVSSLPPTSAIHAIVSDVLAVLDKP